MASSKKKKQAAAAQAQEEVDMTVAPEVLAGITQLRSRAEGLLGEIGRIELHKSNLMEEVNVLNQQANSLVKQESERLGIPAGVQWKITPEGKASIIEAG